MNMNIDRVPTALRFIELVLAARDCIWWMFVLCACLSIVLSVVRSINMWECELVVSSFVNWRQFSNLSFRIFFFWWNENCVKLNVLNVRSIFCFFFFFFTWYKWNRIVWKLKEEDLKQIENHCSCRKFKCYIIVWKTTFSKFLIYVLPLHCVQIKLFIGSVQGRMNSLFHVFSKISIHNSVRLLNCIRNLLHFSRKSCTNSITN